MNRAEGALRESEIFLKRDFNKVLAYYDGIADSPVIRGAEGTRERERDREGDSSLSLPGRVNISLFLFRRARGSAKFLSRAATLIREKGKTDSRKFGCRAPRERGVFAPRPLRARRSTRASRGDA